MFKKPVITLDKTAYACYNYYTPKKGGEFYCDDEKTTKALGKKGGAWVLFCIHKFIRIYVYDWAASAAGLCYSD